MRTSVKVRALMLVAIVAQTSPPFIAHFRHGS